MPKLIDAHTHINFSIYNADYKEVIKRALDQDIWLVNVGTQKDTSQRAIDVAEEFGGGVYPHTKNFGGGVYATVGLHPTHTNKSFHDKKELGGGEEAVEFTSRGEDFDYDYYKKLAAHPKVLAIGECGLDYAVFGREQGARLQKRASADLAFVATSVADASKLWRRNAKETAESEGGLHQGTETIKKKQKETFVSQIDLAAELKKPLMIHCRAERDYPAKRGVADAYKDLIDILSGNQDKLNEKPGIIHFFSGNVEDAEKLMNLGFYFSFGGVTTFTHDYDEVIKHISLEKLILETDAPYVSPVPYRGKRNEPSYIKYIAEAISKILNVSFETVAGKTTENAMKVLKLEIKN